MFSIAPPVRVSSRTGFNSILFALAFALIACGSDSAGSGGFEVRVSGAYDTTIDGAGGSQSLTRSEVEGLPPIYSFRFLNEAGNEAVTIAYYGDAPPVGGSYGISSDASAELEGAFTAVFVNRKDMATFGQSDGSVSMEVNAGVYSGSFDFQALGGKYGLGDDRVSVQGTFEGLSLTE